MSTSFHFDLKKLKKKDRKIHQLTWPLKKGLAAMLLHFMFKLSTMVNYPIFGRQHLGRIMFGELFSKHFFEANPRNVRQVNM